MIEQKMRLGFLLFYEILPNVGDGLKIDVLIRLKMLVAPLKFVHTNNSHRKNFYLYD